jgi:hypothetical protein
VATAPNSPQTKKTQFTKQSNTHTHFENFPQSLEIQNQPKISSTLQLIAFSSSILGPFSAQENKGKERSTLPCCAIW